MSDKLDKELGFESDETLGFEPDDGLGFEAEAKPEVPYSESLKHGVEQGASLGFSDEIAGANEAIGQKLFGVEGLGNQKSFMDSIEAMVKNPKADPMEAAGLKKHDASMGLEEMLAAYKSGRDQNREAVKVSSEANPKTAFAGNLLGGAAIPVGAFGQIPKAAGAMQKVGGAILQGARAGTVAGLGTSEADNIPEMIEDSGSGMVTGGGIGGLVQGGAMGLNVANKAAGYPLKKMGEIIGEIPAVQKTIETYKQHRAGNKVVGSSAYKKIGDEAIQVADEVNTKLFDQGSKLAKEQADILKNSNESINVLDTLEQVKQEAKNIKEVGEYRKADKSAMPKIADDIKSQYQLNQDDKAAHAKVVEHIKEIEEFIAKQQNVHAKQTKLVQSKLDLLTARRDKLLKNATTDISPQELDNIDKSITQLKMSLSAPTEEVAPEMLQNLERLHQAKQQLEMQAEENLKNVKPSDVKDIVKTFRSMSGSNTQNMSLAPELKSQEAQMAINNAANNLQEQMSNKIPAYGDVNQKIQSYNAPLEEIGLGSVNKSFQDPAEVGAAKSKLLNIIKGADRESESAIKSRDAIKKIEQATNSVNPELAQEIVPKMQDVSKRLDLAKSSIGGGGATSSTLNLVGRAQGGAAIAGDAVRDLNKATPEAIKQVAAKLAAAGGTSAELARVLLKAADAPTRSKQAIIFGLMQNPSYRKLLNSGSKDERSK